MTEKTEKTSDFKPAAADDSPDGRYTNKDWQSPGMPGQPTPEPTEYPKWVKGPDGADVIVESPDHAKAASHSKPPEAHSKPPEAGTGSAKR
jgi:hypothetical protein